MAVELPKTYKKLVAQKLTTNFREAVGIVEAPLPKPQQGEVLVRNRYVGVNATDVNITGGKYFVDTPPPFDIGFEAVGEIVAIGENVTTFKIGQSVAFMEIKAYAEYSCVPQTSVFPLPGAKPEYLALLVSGLTASVGLDKVGRITEGETVLVTAAAGGTGHIAVQWAKAAGCHVVGTASSEKKIQLLKSLGCDRVINYKTEDLDEVLTKEYPNGIDVVWETIGGQVFETLLKHIAIKGRLLIVGGITGYVSGEGIPKVDLSHVPAMLLFKSAALLGFLVLQYKECFPTYFKYLADRTVSSELKIVVDNGEDTGKEFLGLESIVRGVEHLHSGTSIGKVYVKIA